MTFKKIILAGAVLAPFLFAAPAHAGNYCREYNKTITVGGHYESGYGTACMQPDGSWMIVELRGTVDPFDDLRRQRDVVIISDQRPVYYNYGPTYRPVTYYPRARYAPAPGFYFNFTNIDRDRDNGRRHWDNRNYDRHDNRWDGRGRDNNHRGRHD